MYHSLGVDNSSGAEAEIFRYKSANTIIVYDLATMGAVIV